MAYQTAKGAGPATGMSKTPAPTKPMRQAAPDAVLSIRNPTAQNYGENGPRGNASRTNPGEHVESDLAANMRQSSDDGEGVLDKIVAGGAHSVDMGPHADISWQTRAYDPKAGVPIHPGTSGASAGPKIPTKCGAPVSAPVRKPGR